VPKTESVITMLAIYDDVSSAASTVAAIMKAGIVPLTLEMMDNMIIQAVEKGGSCGYPIDAAAVLIIEVEGITTGLKEQAEQVNRICMETGCREVRTAKTQAERELLWKGRKGAFGAICNLSPNYLVNDGCVLRSDLPVVLDRVKEISEKYGCPVANVFHAGDGNLHPLLMFDSRNAAEVDQVHKAGWDIMKICAEFGGTISGEHGIGEEKRDAMTMVFSGHDLNTQRKVKKALDPKDLLNPQKVIPLVPEGSDQLPDTKPTVLKRLGGETASGVGEAMAAIRKAAGEKKAVRIAGKGTFNGFGNALKQEVVVLDSLNMTDFIEYDKDNQFITVGSGVALEALQAKLGGENQWLPIRPPFCDGATTIGAVVAMATVGPERLAYGAPRDLLLGLQYIDASGSMVSTGGRVVKNVAGFDMTRLLTGSLGTLGFITESTWKTATRPEICKKISASGSFANCFEAGLNIVKSHLQAALVTITPGEGGQATLSAGFEGLEMVVDSQVERCSEVMKSAALSVDGAEQYPLLEGYLGSAFAALWAIPFTLQADVVISQGADFVSRLSPIARPAELLLDAAHGRVYAGFDALTGEQWQKIDALAASCKGHCRLLKAPESFAGEHDLFGASRPEWRLSHLVKQALDPHKVFAPGALPGRI
jgi:FAD/FMN-containing dehydrogenase